MPHRKLTIFTSVDSEHMCVLRLQWALWKVLAPKIIMDSERFNRLAQQLAQELYDSGVRFPPPVTAPIVASRIEEELHTLVRQSAPGTWPTQRRRLAQRFKLSSTYLAERGYRHIVGLACVNRP